MVRVQLLGQSYRGRPVSHLVYVPVGVAPSALGGARSMQADDPFCIDITYWVDVDKAKVTQDQIKMDFFLRERVPCQPLVFK